MTRPLHIRYIVKILKNATVPPGPGLFWGGGIAMRETSEGAGRAPPGMISQKSSHVPRYQPQGGPEAELRISKYAFTSFALFGTHLLSISNTAIAPRKAWALEQGNAARCGCHPAGFFFIVVQIQLVRVHPFRCE